MHYVFKRMDAEQSNIDKPCILGVCPGDLERMTQAEIQRAMTEESRVEDDIKRGREQIYSQLRDYQLVGNQ